ncbi:MAG TPA: LysR family transcriptional regulator [Polyangiaceae bacterium]|nr:LysR family transcriptional regulator [Polyangiaceae bacterium]
MVSETLELTVFHSVVKHSSYAKAADELLLSPSGVSRIVSRLEERLGARLVQRTTRKLSLTEAGAAFHARTAQILLDLADAEAEVQETALRPRGNLRVSAAVVFGQLFIGQLLDQLLHTYPELSVDLSLTDRFVDLIDEGMDLAIRIGSLTDSRLMARRLCTNHRVLVASPDYLERRGVPKHPSELSEHDCVLFNSFARPREWKLLGPEGQVTVNVSGRMASNNADVVASSAKRGHGITVGATLVVGPALRSGELVRVLSDWEFEKTAIFALYPSARQLSTKVRATVDFLAHHLTDPPSWDRELVGVPGFTADFHGP